MKKIVQIILVPLDVYPPPAPRYVLMFKHYNNRRYNSYNVSRIIFHGPTIILQYCNYRSLNDYYYTRLNIRKYNNLYESHV